MSLSESTLASEIETAILKDAQTPGEAAADLAAAIVAWASTAKSCALPGLPTNLVALEPTLAIAFASAFSPGPSQASVGSGVDAGLVAFFVGAAFSGVSPTAPSVPPNAVSGTAGTGTAMNGDDVAETAGNLAAAIHGWAAGGNVVVSHLGLPPPTPAGVPCSTHIS